MVHHYMQRTMKWCTSRPLNQVPMALTAEQKARIRSIQSTMLFQKKKMAVAETRYDSATGASLVFGRFR